MESWVITNSLPIMLDVNHPGPDYTLRWPRELFVQEGRALQTSEPLLLKGTWTDQVEWLLEEAFASTTPLTDFQQSDLRSTWSDDSAGRVGKVLPYLRQPALFLQALIAAAPGLPQASTPKPYYAARHGLQLVNDDRPPDPGAVRRDWSGAIASLQRNDYLAHMGQFCVDDRFPEPEALDDVIADRLGQRGLWSLKAEDWDDPSFYSLIEVFHDLVQRPRNRYFHSYNSCGYHFSDFAFYPAQVLYRWTGQPHPRSS